MATPRDPGSPPPWDQPRQENQGQGSGEGQGGYGPQIANNQLLVQTSGLRRLLLDGQNVSRPIGNYMPPVARGWTDRQFQALFSYLKANVYKGSTSGG